LHRSLKRNVVLALAALAVAAFAGGAYAATQNSGPNTRQAFLNDIAKRLHVTPSQLSAAVNGATTDQLQAEVKAGQITQAQANALEQRLKNGGSTPLLPLTPGLAGPRGFLARPPGNGAFPARPFGQGQGQGQSQRHGFGFGFGFGGFGLNAAASYLGLSNAQLLQQLRSGKSLAQITTAKGKTVAGLEQAMTAPLKKGLDAAVARKVITAAKEQQILSRLSSALSQRINQKGLVTPAQGALRGLFRGGPGGPAGQGGQGGPAGPGGPGKPYGPPFAMPAPGGAPAPGKGTAPTTPGTPKTPAQPGALPQQLFQPAPTA
jgi:hypothetical protein